MLFRNTCTRSVFQENGFLKDLEHCWLLVQAAAYVQDTSLPCAEFVFDNAKFVYRIPLAHYTLQNRPPRARPRPGKSVRRLPGGEKNWLAWYDNDLDKEDTDTHLLLC